MKTCSSCGNIESDSARFCGSCGAALNSAPEPAGAERSQDGGGDNASPAAAAPTAVMPATIVDDRSNWPLAASATVPAPAQMPLTPASSVPAARGRHPWRWLLLAVVVVCLAGAAGGLWAGGILPPKHDTTLSDATFSDGVNGPSARGLAKADERAQTDLAKGRGGTTSNGLDEDGATIAAFASQAMSELRGLGKLSSSQAADLRLLERFITANRAYGLALQQYHTQGSRSAQIQTTAATAAAADRVAASSVASAASLPSPAVFAISSPSSHHGHQSFVIPSGLKACGRGISVNAVTTCPFAANVFKGYVRDYRIAGKQTDVQVEAFSPITSRAYSMDCFFAGRQVVACTGGKKAFVTFPFTAVVSS
jgi:hypothetical protein